MADQDFTTKAPDRLTVFERLENLEPEECEMLNLYLNALIAKKDGRLSTEQETRLGAVNEFIHCAMSFTVELQSRTRSKPWQMTSLR